MEDDDDFTFPTVAAAAARAPAPEGQLGSDDGPVARVPRLPLPDLAAGGSPLWPFAGSVGPKTTTAPAPAPAPAPSSPPLPATADDDEQAPAPASGGSGRAGRRVAADEDRMDRLWEGTTTATTATRSITTAPAPEPRSVDHAGPPKQRSAADVDGDDTRRTAAVADADRMDKLWESFNEDLVLRHRDRARRSKSAADDHPAGDDHWYLCDYSPPWDAESDQETSASSPSPAERRGYGCAPTMLRASSRAGGAGQFCASPRGRPSRGRSRGAGAAAGWALLLRLFRRLFAVDKTAPSSSSSRSHSSIYVP